MRARLAALGALVASAALAQAPAPAPAPAPPAPDPAAVAAAFAKTDAYKKLTAQALARVPGTVLQRCPKLTTSDAGLSVTQPLKVNAGNVTGGSWRQSLLAHGCGSDVMVNFFFYGTPEGRVLTVVGVPGTTRTDLVQQRDARTYTVMALEPMGKGCHQFETVNTRFEGFGSKTPAVADPGAEAPFRPWWESWTVLGCGKRYEIPLNFTPNRLGMQITQPGGVVER